MFPLLKSGSAAFSTTQEIDWSVQWYDTTMSVPQTGIGFRIANPSSTFTTAGMQNASAAATVAYFNDNTTPVLTNSGTWGRVPLIMDYWGTGAPPGITKSRFVAMHFRGFMTDVVDRQKWAHPLGTDEFSWLSFAGNGFIKVVLSNNLIVLNTKLTYDNFVSIQTALSLSYFNDFDIYYWQLGEPWGGLVGKYVPKKISQSVASSEITLDQYREAPVISSSILTYADNGLGTQKPNVDTLEQVLNATIETVGPMDTPLMKFDVPLSNQDSISGWRLLNNPRRLQFTPVIGSPITVKRRQLVIFSGGFSGEQYLRFAGNIQNFDENNGIVSVECVGIEDRMAKANIENFPDKISYCTFGYFKTFSTSEPVFDITAYDNWALEHAVKDLCYKGGIDSRLLSVTRTTNNINGTITDIQDEVGNKHYYFRARSMGGNLIKLPKPSLYGNAGAGFNPNRPSDDEYIYKPNISRSVLDFAREIADSLGYDFRSNALGAIVLAPRNNPHRLSEYSTPGTEKFSASALGGKYQELTSTPFTVTKTLNGARFDLAAARSGPGNLGTLNYTVNIMSGAQVAAGSINLHTGAITDVFFYDNRFTITGNNIVVNTLYSGKWGQYTITLTNGAGSKWWIDAILIYDYDSQRSALPKVLLTDESIESLKTQSYAQESINKVLIIGKRKSTVTDSDKFRNPNNTQNEFFVAAGADPSSIWDPLADNYVGGEVATIISDSKVSDQDYANWAAQTLLTRQRDPGPSAEFEHPILPFLEPRDPLNLSDQNYSSITGSSLVWVNRISESYELSKSTSKISTTAYAQIPSYDPRKDLSLTDLDANFFGQPATNVTITYPSIDSGSVTNPGPNLANAKLWGYTGDSTNYLTTEQRVSTYGSDANGTFILMSGTVAWPPIPDSISLGKDTVLANQVLSAFYRSLDYNTKKNNPYMKFWHIYDYNTKKIHLPCLAGDNQSQYQLGGWGMGTVAQIGFKGLDSTLSPATVYSGRAPFYDPYISELPDGNFVDIKFDALISGYYRVSIWDVKNRNSPTLITWLTEPTQENINPELHWTYLTAGKSKQFLWDGVDSIGTWNKKQSEDYSWTARGWFEKDQLPAIGKGFYVWNDKTSEIVTISGQMLGGKLVFNPDHYSQFYLKIEVLSDIFSEVEANSIRIVDSTQLKGVAQGQNAQSSICIYTHLPQPTKVKISTIEDWDPSVKTYDPIADPTGTTGWVVLNSGIGDAAGTLRDDKPVRISYQAIARPGGRFSGNNKFTTFKMHRITHLNANIMDMFILFEGVPWHGLTPIEKKRIVTRRLTNSQHTLDFGDTDFRTGDSLNQFQNKWVFRPFDFQLDVGGQQQPIEYCKYLQLEDVPGFSINRTIGQQKSRLILAYMNYIFYMSTYIQDRSGRMTWVIDPLDIDYTKILANKFPVEFPEDLESYSTRTIIARQWNDPKYINDMSAKWNIGSSSDAYRFIQFFHNRLGRNDNSSSKALRLDANGNSVTGLLTTGFNDPFSTYHKSKNQLIASYLTNRMLGNWTTPSTITHFFGGGTPFVGWTWEGNPDMNLASEDVLWLPDLTRDFHPHILCAPMPQMLDNLTAREYYGLNSADRVDIDFSSLHIHISADQSLNDSWFSIVWSPADPPPGIFSDHKFRVGHSAEEGLQPQTQPEAFVMNYQRQIEHTHWEEYRGFLSTGKLPGRNPLLVVPNGGAYLQNLYAYSDIQRDNRITNVGIDEKSFISPLEVEYRVAIANPEQNPIDGWFQWTFRSKYTWYSSSYFPVQDYRKLDTKFLYPKYSVVDNGIPVEFDSGAWVGWKDDLNSSTTLVWKDFASTQRAAAPVNIGNHTNSNIFFRDTSNGNSIEKAPIALCQKFSVSKDVLISLVLENSRRSKAISGK